MEDACERASIFVTATGCANIINENHFLKMRENAIICNIGHFDCELNLKWLEDNAKKDNIKPQVSSSALRHHNFS